MRRKRAGGARDRAEDAPKRRRKRKPRLPRGFDPANPGPLDPERWLPKWQRSDFKRRRQRRRDKVLAPLACSTPLTHPSVGNGPGMLLKQVSRFSCADSFMSQCLSPVVLTMLRQHGRGAGEASACLQGPGLHTPARTASPVMTYMPHQIWQIMLHQSDL